MKTQYQKMNPSEYGFLKQSLIDFKNKGIKLGFTEEQMLTLLKNKIPENFSAESSISCFFSFNFAVLFMIIVTILSLMLNGKEFSLSRCIIENNYFIMEMTRPVTDCNICKNIKGFTILENVTKEEFYHYAYVGKPLLVKGGCLNWTAIDVFDFDFFKKLYSSTSGAFETVEDECQFFPFRTKFLSLHEVFNMPLERAKMLHNAETWYIGWSNCNPDISNILRQHYSKPYFLPDDSELSAIDWIFMGYQGQGASMHLDYVRRPSWQAQIRGKKSWYLLPPPECEHICTPMNITVLRGDIILVDTNQWYHTTRIEGDEMSLTLGSEYD